MAGDPWEDTTSCGYTVTSSTYETSSSTDTTLDYGITRWLKVTITKYPKGTCTHTIQYSNPARDDNEILIKKLRKKQVVLDMKSKWIKKDRKFKPITKLRSTVQLRGVSFSGRGWA